MNPPTLKRSPCTEVICARIGSSSCSSFSFFPNARGGRGAEDPQALSVRSRNARSTLSMRDMISTYLPPLEMP
jgi:hypothetical protein